jgi:hypothetical protein
VVFWLARIRNYAKWFCQLILHKFRLTREIVSKNHRACKLELQDISRIFLVTKCFQKQAITRLFWHVLCCMKQSQGAFPQVFAGGQPGADRAALDWAIANGIPHGGWYPCPELNGDARFRKPLLYPFELQGLKITQGFIPTPISNGRRMVYRYPNDGIHYARVKRNGKQFRASLKTSDRQLAGRKLADFNTKVGRLAKLNTPQLVAVPGMVNRISRQREGAADGGDHPDGPPLRVRRNGSRKPGVPQSPILSNSRPIIFWLPSWMVWSKSAPGSASS